MKSTSDRHLKAQVAIIGAGAAGVTLALELEKAGISSILIPGAGWREKDHDRDLYRGLITPKDSHEALELNRVRQIGGSTSLWGGRCVPYEPADFLPHPCGLREGWPIEFQDVARYYDRACAWCECGPNDFTSPHAVLPEFSDCYITGSNLERWSPPVDFGIRYRTALKHSRQIKLLEGFSAIEFIGSTDGVAHSLRIRNVDGESFCISAEYFVVAAGGLESNRLLLQARRETWGHNFGGESLGRYFMGHINGVAAEIFLHKPETLFYRFFRDSSGVFIRPRLGITPQALRDFTILNCVALFERGGITQRAEPIEQATSAAKQILRLIRLGRHTELARSFPQLSTSFLTSMLQDPQEVLDAIRGRFFSQRRLPTVLRKQKNPFGITYQGEEMPLAGSFVELDETSCDAYGMPRIKLHFNLSPVSYQTIIVFHRLIDAALRKGSYGYVLTDQAEIERRVFENPRSTMAHHLGGTRMSIAPAKGVVDTTLKVHGMKNLFVASTSTFPTGSHANPTLTLVALTCRLADHLRHLMQSSPILSA